MSNFAISLYYCAGPVEGHGNTSVYIFLDNEKYLWINY